MSIRKLLIALACLPVWLTPLYSQAEPLYVVSVLPGDFSPSDINNVGQIVGITNLGINAHAAVYANGTVTDLGAFGGKSSAANEINDAGWLTGDYISTTGETHGFIYNNGNVIDMGARSSASGINAQGDVVGAISVGETHYRGYQYHDGIITVLGALGTGTIADALDINDAGTMVGLSNLDDTLHSPFHPVLYTTITGVANDLGTLGNYETNDASFINNAGQIAGSSESASDGQHAYRYENGVMTDFGGFHSLFLNVNDMNEQGVLVGSASTLGDNVGFVSLNGVVVDLSTLLDPLLGWSILAADGINDAGQIVGYGCINGVCSSVLLSLANPIPEPAEFALLLAGLLTLPGMRWRHIIRRMKATVDRAHARRWCMLAA